MKLFLTRRWPESVEQRLSEGYQLTVNARDATLDERELQEVLNSFDAVCPTVSDRITARMLVGSTPRLKILANYGVGVSHIDLDACSQAGIVVTNTPDVLTECTADLAITLLLMIARRAGEGERLVREHAWTGWRPTHMLGVRVTGKKVGLVGFGRIGQAVAMRAHRGFGMEVMYYSRRRVAPELESVSNAHYCRDLNDLLAKADFVSLHCPGGAENRHLIDERRLARMQRSAFLINTSRGEVVDEHALVEALRLRRIAGAALDVYECEPRIPAALSTLDNVVVLPHLGSATLETRVAMGERVTENLEDFFAGRPPRDRVV